MTETQASLRRKTTTSQGKTIRYRTAQEPKEKPQEKPQAAQEGKKPEQAEKPQGTDKKPQEKPQETPQEGKKPEQKPKTGNKSLTREFTEGNAIRALDGEGNERKFVLSFSSEEPYNRGWCLEILDHAPGAVNIARLNDIGVLLFNHKRDAVLGRINRAWIEGNRGYAEVEFDTDEAAEVIYQKVKSGTLKGVSVGYRIESIEEVMPGRTSADGRFTGPCDVARKWEPFEISIVSVPADPTVGVGREFEETDGTKGKRAPSLRERQLQININKFL